MVGKESCESLWKLWVWLVILIEHNHDDDGDDDEDIKDDDANDDVNDDDDDDDYYDDDDYDVNDGDVNDYDDANDDYDDANDDDDDDDDENTFSTSPAWLQLLELILHQPSLTLDLTLFFRISLKCFLSDYWCLYLIIFHIPQ